MDDRSYSSLGRHGLGSCYSYLDGVPFKIGQQFKQPSQIVVPPDVARTKHSKVLEEEYTFQTEEAVIAWAKARDEALKRAAEEQAEKQAEKLRQKAEQFTEGGVDSCEQNTSVGKGSVEVLSVGSDKISGGIVPDIKRDVSITHPDHGIDTRAKPAVPPKPTKSTIIETKPVPNPGLILKPVPIQPVSNTQQGSEQETHQKTTSADSHFDVSMFEQEADPFENLELQTINEMEELKIVLESKPAVESVSKDCVSESSENQPEGNRQENSDEGIYDVASVIRENVWETFDEEIPKQRQAPNSEAEKDIAVPNNDSSFQALGKERRSSQACDVEDGEYVEIPKNYSHQSVGLPKHGVNGVNKSFNTVASVEPNDAGTALGGKLPPSLINSKLYKPVLPPIHNIGKANTNGNCDSQSNPMPQNLTRQTNPFLINPLQSSNPFLQENSQQGQPFSSMQATNWGNRNPFGDLDCVKSTTSSHNKRRTPPPIASKPVLRPSSNMWSSVGPSLASSLDDSTVNPPQLPINTYSRHSLSTTDLCAINCDTQLKKSSVLIPPPSSSSQTFNRLQPLPPTPSSSPDGFRPSLLPTPRPVGLTDPYFSLSQEAKAFTDSLTSMGFLRARVARAVDNFGTDEKEVLDHLIAVDKLVDKKYAPVIVESALHTYKNDVEKAEKYLKMHSHFEELGFKSELIHKALVTVDIDHDRALDFLTA